MDSSPKFEEVQYQHKLTDHEITYYYLKWLSLAKDWNSLKQEYPITPEEAFISSGIKFIDAEALDYFHVYEGKVEGSVTIFKEYNPLHSYVLGADVAEGVGLDSSTIVVIDLDTVEVVATYKDNRIEADVFGDVCAAIGRRYGNCMIGVERNNNGHTTLAKLKTVYPVKYIYSEVRVDKELNQETDKLGWHTTWLLSLECY